MYFVSFVFRIKLFIEEIEREEALLLEDLYSMDRKFAEHYNVRIKGTYASPAFYLRS